MAETKTKAVTETATKKPAAKKPAAKVMVARTLLASEIECRVGVMREDGCSLLLYKDARVDMRLLDEVYGPMNWKREHMVVNGSLFCTISIWDEDKKEWISKQDVGSESNTEKEKGQASDSFKRAAFNWGIGRELYSAPFVWVKLTKDDLSYSSSGTPKLKTKFTVAEIEYNDSREIIKLVIVDKDGKPRFTFPYEKKETVKKTAEVKGVFTGSALTEAITAAKNCKNSDEINAVWGKYQEMQNNSEFRSIIQQKCEEIRR